ncbi:Mitochondrial transcription termination factor family protein [Melia azedarach]|uniref:Mitochondrial transcription termination factor family protein n=1 Tax=Melia azedarach TaxID=155640 RepID=A0ACC1YVW2_MELAZ|nr:Mitochondrial transcription termination factor family protein [Melia azedarach]
MYGFFNRRLALQQVVKNCYRSVVQDLENSHLGFIQNARLFPISIKLFSSGNKEVKSIQSEEYSFTVAYLVNSCGLSPETAKSAAKRVKFESSEKPDSVLQILKSSGFANTQIAKLIRVRPNILLAHPERSILPKLEFLKSIGITDAEIANVCSSNPAILGQSLENSLIPNYNFLKSVLLSDENVIKTFRKKQRIFNQDLPKKVSPKLAVLRELGVPESFIALALTCFPAVVLQAHSNFDENVKKVIELGFDPRKCAFIHAMQVFASISQPTREHKLDVLRRWGWSEEDIRLAFRRCPVYLNSSENKIISGLDFLVNKMGWKSTAIAKYPDTFLMNLEKRVIPRCSVIKVLQLRGLLKKNLSLGQILGPVEKVFLGRFVTKYGDDIPQLVNIYKCKEDLQSLDLNCNVSPATIVC